MDTDQRLRNLEEDLKNAREMISHLSGILQTMTKLGGKDESLHKKLDKILENQEKQSELERRMDMLKEEVKNATIGVRYSKETMKILDTVETSVGYSELFVKDFERIHQNLDSLNAKIVSGFTQNCEKMDDVRDGVSEDIFSVKMEIQQGFKQTEAHLQELEATIEKVTKIEGRLNELMVDMEAMNLNFSALKDQIKESLKKSSKEHQKHFQQKYAKSHFPSGESRQLIFPTPLHSIPPSTADPQTSNVFKDEQLHQILGTVSDEKEKQILNLILHDRVMLFEVKMGLVRTFTKNAEVLRKVENYIKSNKVLKKE